MLETSHVVPTNGRNLRTVDAQTGRRFDFPKGAIDVPVGASGCDRSTKF